MIGVALIYIAFYAFVFAMCYFFSPWFAFLLFLAPSYKENKQTGKDSNTQKAGEQNARADDDTQTRA